jgi:hypothetical protein
MPEESIAPVLPAPSGGPRVSGQFPLLHIRSNNFLSLPAWGAWLLLFLPSWLFAPDSSPPLGGEPVPLLVAAHNAASARRTGAGFMAYWNHTNTTALGLAWGVP